MATAAGNSNTSTSDSQGVVGGEAPEKEDSTFQTEQSAYKLCETFAKGLGTGMDYNRVLKVLKRQGIEERIIEKLRIALFEKGDSLGHAFARFGILEQSARQLLLVAEQQGNLPQTFRELAESYEKRHEQKKQTVQAFAMPALIFAIGGIVFIYHFLLQGGIIEMAQGKGGVWGQAPGILANAGLNVGIFFAVLAVAGYTYLNFPIDSSIRRGISWLWARIPIVSETTREKGLSIFCKYLARSIAGGLSVHKGLKLAANASGHPHLETSIEDVRNAIEEGENLTTAMREVDDIPEDIYDMIDIGEESGELVDQLEKLATRYERAAEERFERRQTIFTRFLLLSVVVGVVLAVFVTVGSELMTRFSRELSNAGGF